MYKVETRLPSRCVKRNPNRKLGAKYSGTARWFAGILGHLSIIDCNRVIPNDPIRRQVIAVDD